MHLNIWPCVILMRNGIIEQFPKCFLRYLKSLVTLHPLETNRRNKIFGLKSLHHTVGHLNYVPLNNILEHQVSFILTKPANFENHTWKVLLRVLSKQEDGCVLQVSIVIE